MSHLRDLVAALLDGELNHADRERALTHLANCAPCRAEVAAQRAIKQQVSAAAVPGVPAGLLANLQRMAEPGEPMPPVRRGPGEVTRPPTVFIGGRPPNRADRAPGPSTGRRRVHRAFGVGAVAVTTLVTAFAVGGDPGPDVTTVRPDVDSYLIEHVRASRLQPFAEVSGETISVTGVGRNR